MNQYFRQAIIFAAILSFAVTALASSDAGRESVFSVGVGARSLGMGGGFTSIADDATSVYYNPAGLVILKNHELSFMHMSLFEGTIFDFGAWGFPISDKFGMGIGYMRIGTDDIIKTQNFIPLGTFTYSQSQWLVSMGAKAGKHASVGLTVKAVNQEIDNQSDYAFALDAGAIINADEHIRLGIAARDAIPPKLKLNSTEEQTPTSVAGGVALVNYPLSNNSQFSASCELEKSEDRSTKVHTGGEILFDNAYAVRAGYDRDNVSLGVGYVYRMVSFDYAYKLMDHVDNSHRLSVSVLLGETQKSLQKTEETESQKPTTGPVQYEFTKQFKFYKEKADDYYDQSQLDSALMYYRRAQDFEKDNQEVNNRILMIAEALHFQKQKGTVKPTPPPPPTSRTETVSDTTKIVQIYYDLSHSFYAKHYYLPALDLIEQILVMQPQHTEAKQLGTKIQIEIDQGIENNLRDGQSAEKSGDFSRAVEAYTRVLELDPTNANARQSRDRLFGRLSISEKLYLGIKQFEENKLAPAKGQFEAVLAIEPDNEIALNYMEKINKTIALPTTLDVLQADPVIWPLYLDGLKFMRDKQYQKAIEAWQKVLKAYPNSTDAINNISQARLRLDAAKEK